jgi:hypothetical protein
VHPGEPPVQRQGFERARTQHDAPKKKRNYFFFEEKRKKLLLFAPSRRLKWANQGIPLTDKSFLVLFSKRTASSALACHFPRVALNAIAANCGPIPRIRQPGTYEGAKLSGS